MRIAFAVLVLLSVSASPAVAQSCQITGQVPQQLRAIICDIATSVHGDGELNRLTLRVNLGLANEIRSESPSVEDMLLNLLDAWKGLRGATVASVEVYYGRAHLATAQTRLLRSPSVTFR